MDLLKGAVGSGPYRIRSVTQSEITLERTPLYYTTTNGPDVGVFRKTDDFGNFERLKSWVTLAALEYQPQPEPSFSHIEFSELGTHQLIFNNSRSPFNDVKVRRAVALSIDYSTLSQSLKWSKDTLQAGLVPLGMAGFQKRNIEGRPAQLEKAKKFLMQAGFSERHPLKFTITLSRLATYSKEADLWPRLFSGVPIQVNVDLVDHAERNMLQDQGEFQAMRITKFAGSVESHRVLSSYLSGSTYNPTRSQAPVCDRLTALAISTADRDARLTIYAKADHCLIDRAILVPLASIQPGYVVLRKPWQLTRTNRYLLYPYWISEWRQ